jgi:hypothetical protein
MVVLKYALKYLKMALAIPVAYAALVVSLVSLPITFVWAVMTWANATVGSPLPPSLYGLRMPHWYLGRAAEALWLNRSINPWR